MYAHENIIHLAQNNSHKCYPKRLENIDQTIPYFQITKSPLGKYDMQCFAYEHHDNADRMQLWQQYLQQMILPNIDYNIDVSGYYNIQLHDSYTYLDDNKDYKDVLCFSKFKNDNGPILIPDPYMICNWGNMLNSINDEQEWTKKKNKIVFVGTTTGNRDHIKNERINTCLWSLNNNNKDFCDFYITKVAQMDILNIRSKILNFDKIYRNPMSIYEQLLYKYQLSIDGNTCKFNIEQFKMNSVAMKYESKEMLWYYPLLQEDVHYIGVNKDNIKNKFDFFNNNPSLAQIIIYNAKKLSNNIFRPIMHQMYTVKLFESIALNK
jgi:hypothetical protein